MQSTFEKLAVELSRALSPLQRVTGSLDSYANFMLTEFGWDVNDIPKQIKDLITDIGNLVTLTKDISDSDDIDYAELIEITTVLIKLIDDIKKIKSNPNTNGLVNGQFLKDLPEELLNYLFVEYLEHYPLGSATLQLLGITSREQVVPTPPRLMYLKREVNWNYFIEILTKPKEVFKNVYQWGTTDFDFLLFINNCAIFMNALGLRTTLEQMDNISAMVLEEKASAETTLIKYFLKIPFVDPDEDTLVDDYGIGLFPLPQNNTLKPGFAIMPYGKAKVDDKIKITDNLYFVYKTSLDVTGGIGLVIRPEQDIKVFTGFKGGSSNSAVNGSFKAGLLFAKNGNETIKLITIDEGTYLEIQSISTYMGIALSSGNDRDLFAELELKGGKLVIGAEGTDGFLSAILPSGGIKASFELLFGVSAKRGAYFGGSGGLEIKISTNIKLGPVELQAITISATPKNDIIPLKIGASVKAALGPLKIVVENIGLTLDLSFPEKGNLGPINIDPGFKAPDGVGISIDASAVKGSGFLYIDTEKQEYTGALELTVLNTISVKAIGIITTKMPDGSKGYSLLILVSAEFTPIQLGYGFTLNGVGGLLGLNRTVVVEKLRTGVKDNSLKSILFPENVVENISRIISDLKQVFPVYQAHFVIGPMGKLGYGTPTLITLELGIIIELPDPLIAILGVLKTVLPHETQPILTLQVNFLGVIDIPRKEISFDASLYGSRLLIFTLSGDMALRINWGDNPVFILSVGGFHPDFKEIPAGLTDMKRLSISLLSGDNPRISIESYFAVTSNTVQFGAKAELYAAACGFNVYGYIGFDVLFQFDPFYFIASVYAGLALRCGSTVLLSVELSGQLSGPKPWNAKGKASFRIIFKFTISFDKTWGEESDETEPELADVYAELKTALSDNRNWLAETPDNNSLNVTLNKIEANDDEVIIHPFGVVSVSQKVVPLEITIDKFGNKEPQDETLFKIASIKSKSTAFTTQNVLDHFAPANFIDLSDSEKLSRKSFEQLKSGKKLTDSSNLVTGKPVEKTVDYELSYLKKNIFKLVVIGIYKLATSLFKFTLKGSAAYKSNLSFCNRRMSVNAPKQIVIEKEKYVIANTSDLTMAGAVMVAYSQTEAYEMMKAMINEKPELKNTIQVVQQHELSTP